MKQGRRALLGLALWGAMSRVLAAGFTDERARRELDAELAAIVNAPACRMTSLSVLAIGDGEVQYEQQFGYRVMPVDGIGGSPADGDTMYRIASISKMMTTLGLMMLAERGKLALDTDVSEYLGFPVRNPHFPDRLISLRTLLTHTSSLRDDAGYSFPAATALREVLVPGARLYGKGAMWAAKAPPGAYFTYANLNWALIGTAMEKVTGERFDRLMKRLLLDPMGVPGGFNPSEFSATELGNLATLYRKRTTDTEIWNAAGPWIAQVDDYRTRAPVAPAGIADYAVGTNATPFSPTGGLRISAAGMGKIMLMLMNGGEHEGKQLIKPATLEHMFRPYWTHDGKGGNGDTDKGLFNSWGLGNQHFPDRPGTGMQLVEGGGFSAVGHLGEAYGLMSVFVADLAKRNGMIALVGGTSSDPAAYQGKYSSMARFQEQILSALYQRAIIGLR